jgi:hypothetical protein
LQPTLNKIFQNKVKLGYRKPLGIISRKAILSEFVNVVNMDFGTEKMGKICLVNMDFGTEKMGKFVCYNRARYNRV